MAYWSHYHILLYWLCVNFAASQYLSFAGYTKWRTKSGSGLGPGDNYWSDDPTNIWVDADGYLHLTVKKDTVGRWMCTETFLEDGYFGYNTYYFVVSGDFGAQDINLIAGIFTYDMNIRSAPANGEIDIEWSRWGAPVFPILGYTVHPQSEDKESNKVFNIASASGTFTHIIYWEPTRVSEYTFRGWVKPRAIDIGTSIASFIYTGPNLQYVPITPRVHFNYWLLKGAPPVNGKGAEFIVNDFKILGRRNSSTDSSTARYQASSTATPAPPECVLEYVIQRTWGACYKMYIERVRTLVFYTDDTIYSVARASLEHLTSGAIRITTDLFSFSFIACGVGMLRDVIVNGRACSYEPFKGYGSGAYGGICSDTIIRMINCSDADDYEFANSVVNECGELCQDVVAISSKSLWRIPIVFWTVFVVSPSIILFTIVVIICISKAKRRALLDANIVMCDVAHTSVAPPSQTATLNNCV